MSAAEKLTLLSAGIFFLVGLLAGVWKYKQIMASENGEAHPYVDICHRASLLYAFASILLLKFLEISQLPDMLELVAVAAALFYFATAILTYAIHGFLKDTDNQLRAPFNLGKNVMPKASITIYMWMLIAAEIGGFLVLFYGVLVEIF